MLWHGKNFRGFLNKAREVLFDKTGTTLQSDNVQDAISEIDSNLSLSTGRNITRPFDKTSDSVFNEIYSFTASSTGQVMVQTYFASASGKYAGIQIRVNGYVTQSWTGVLTTSNTISANSSFKKGDSISIRTQGNSGLPEVNVNINILE